METNFSSGDVPSPLTPPPVITPPPPSKPRKNRGWMIVAIIFQSFIGILNDRF
jgi:hypothetical protein